MQIHKSSIIKLTVFLLTIRSPLILAAIAFYTIAERGMLKKMMVRISAYAIFIMIAAIYSLNLVNGMEEVIGQSRDILLCIVVFIFLMSASEVQEMNPSVIYNSLKFCLVLVAICKVIAIIYASATGIDPRILIELMNKNFGLGMMTLGVTDSAFFRIQIPLDAMVPIFLYFVVKEAVNKPGTKIIVSFVIIMLVISMLLTLSRVIWAETIIIMAMALFKESKAAAFAKTTIILTIFLSIVYFFTPIGDSVAQIIDTRFGSQADSLNAGSDIQRVIQNSALYDAFMSSPLLGNGLGHYVPDVIRAQDAKYLYESQTLSMLMDLGIIGCGILMIFIIYTCYTSALKDGGGLLMPSIALSFWLLSGSFNPFLFGAAGGLMLFVAAKFHTIYRPSFSTTS